MNEQNINRIADNDDDLIVKIVIELLDHKKAEKKKRKKNRSDPFNKKKTMYSFTLVYSFIIPTIFTKFNSADVCQCVCSKIPKKNI